MRKSGFRLDPQGLRDVFVCRDSSSRYWASIDGTHIHLRASQRLALPPDT